MNGSFDSVAQGENDVLSRRQTFIVDDSPIVNNTNCQFLLSCLMINARSLKNKLPDLHNLLYSYDYECIFVTETWLHHGFTSALLDPLSRYNVIRLDRSNSTGGGVCVFIAKSISYEQLDTTSFFPDLEIVVIDAIFKSTTVRFLLVYRAPHMDYNISASLVKAFHYFSNQNGPNVILGDFNCPDIDWINSSSPSDLAQNVLHQYFLNFGFTQCVTRPTRGANILDIVCIDEPLLMSDIDLEAPFSSSDHDSVVFRIEINDGFSHDGKENFQKIYDWRQGDYGSLVVYLKQVHWSEILTVNFDADSIWNAFTAILDEANDRFIPFFYRNSKTHKITKFKDTPDTFVVCFHKSDVFGVS